jgi:hypothetical protein
MGWVNIAGMVGQHETERWVNMLRNIQVRGAMGCSHPQACIKQSRWSGRQYLRTTNPPNGGVSLNSV